jgi:hypothetical protein
MNISFFRADGHKSQLVFIYLLIYSLFNDAVSISHDIASNDRMIKKYELERYGRKRS